MRREETMPKLLHASGGQILAVRGVPSQIADGLEVDTEPSDGTSHVISLLVVPWGSDADVGDYTERFLPGAFKDDLEGRDLERHKVLLMIRHLKRTGSAIIGHMIGFEDRVDGLHADFAVLPTVAGNDAVMQASKGLVAPSIGFHQVKTVDHDGGRLKVRHKARLSEVSLVAWPAYRQAKVTGVKTAVGKQSAGHRSLTPNRDKAILDLKVYQITSNQTGKA